MNSIFKCVFRVQKEREGCADFAQSQSSIGEGLLPTGLNRLDFISTNRNSTTFQKLQLKIVQKYRFITSPYNQLLYWLCKDATDLHSVTLSHCHTVTLSHYHTVTLSNCHTVTLSHCHTVKIHWAVNHLKILPFKCQLYFSHLICLLSFMPA